MSFESSIPSSTTKVAMNSRSSSRKMSSSEQVDKQFKMQHLSLDSAVAPLLPRVTAPFDRSERKRAHTSALYYSECFLRGIQPLDADSAAKDAQDQYDKWWISRTARSENRKHTFFEGDVVESCIPKEESSNANVNRGKRRRTGMEGSSLKSSNIVSVASTGGPSVSDQTSGIGHQGEDDDDISVNIRQISILNPSRRGEVTAAKTRLIEDLKASGGDVKSTVFVDCMKVLEAYYKSKSWDGRGSCKMTPFSLEGNWLTLSKPTYDECKGRNQKGDLLYTLGRMSFGMFKPTNLVCSVQASFNTVRTIDPQNPGRPLHVPKKLMKEIQSGGIHLRTYE